MATPKQIKKIHTVKSLLGLSDDDYRLILSQFGAKSSKDLSERRAADFLRELEDKAVAAGVWKKGGSPRRAGKRPHNLERKPGASYHRLSRSEQLKKIEALLTVGNRPWSYADALARVICKVDSITFVPDGDLYKIITALRKQGQREGWDMSGER